MSIFNDKVRKQITNYIKNNQDRVKVNSQLFNILEGQLLPILEQRILNDLGQKSARAAEFRQAPINYYRKVIDKLTTIYHQGVVRKVTGGTESDQELLEWYERELMANKKLDANNEAYNAYKYSLLHITISDEDSLTRTRTPFIRTIPNHEFLVMNMSEVDPAQADVVIIFMPPIENNSGEVTSVYYVYSDTEFMIIDGNGDILQGQMEEMDQNGVNPFNTLPFVYANASQNLVMPLLQIDDLSMASLVPLLMTDLNYAVKFQAFSMFVGIDIDDQDIQISPNSILSLKSDENGVAPSFNTVKPTVDISQVLSLSSSEISLWLTSKGIRPGAMGNLTADTFASGISKLIDESDTFESRKNQIETYKAFEKEMWDKILKVFHPVWVAGGLIDNRTIFSPAAEVTTLFPTPKPLQTRMELISELKESIDARLESRKGALAQLYPEWTDDEIEEKIAEIDAESAFNAMFEVPSDNQEQERNPA